MFIVDFDGIGTSRRMIHFGERTRAVTHRFERTGVGDARRGVCAECTIECIGSVDALRDTPIKSILEMIRQKNSLESKFSRRSCRPKIR